LKIKKIDISSIFPIIINKIKLIFEDVSRLEKFIFLMSYISELTVFVRVNIDNLKDFSNPILSITNRLDKIKRLRKKDIKIRNAIFVGRARGCCHCPVRPAQAHLLVLRLTGRVQQLPGRKGCATDRDQLGGALVAKASSVKSTA